MILVDTSVWVDHLRGSVRALEQLILTDQVLCHAFVTGELALGNLRDWAGTVGALKALPQARLVNEDEVLTFISAAQLAGTGLGLVDVHLLASCRITSGTSLWSRDKRLARYAERLGVAWAEP